MNTPYDSKTNQLYLYVTKPEDIQQILQIEIQSFPSPWTRNMFLEELNNPLSQSFVAKRLDLDNAILGYIFYQVVAFEMHILNIAVHPSYRDMGIGTTLLQRSLEKESRRGFARYAFLEVRENNSGAIRLYEKLGFKQIGVRKNYYMKEKVNALIMGRPIG